MTARLIAAIHKPVKPLWLALLAVCLLCLCGIRAFTGFDGMNRYSHDLSIFLDGGWRVLNGQVPYNDFFSELGTFIHLHTALGLKLAGGHAEGLAYSEALMGCLVGLWAAALAYRRLIPLLAILFVWLVVLLTIAPSLIGDPATQITAACFYNRYGYALAALIILEAFQEASPKSVFLGGLSTGVIAGLLLFTKISYFMGAGFLIVAMLPCRKQEQARWKGMAAGFAMVFVPMLLYMRFTLVPMLSSLRLLAGAKHIALLPGVIAPAASATFYLVVVALTAVGLMLRDKAILEARRITFTAFAVSAASVFFLLTNYQRGRLPLLPVLGLLIIQQVEWRFRDRLTNSVLVRSAICLWTAVFVIGSLALDAGPLALALGFHIEDQGMVSLRFHSPKLSGFRDLQPPYVAMVNEGIELLKKHRRPADTVASLDFSNPFSYALGIAPPWGGTSAGLLYQTTFDEEHKLPPEYLFGHASLVMVPIVFSEPTLQDSIPLLYGPYLYSHFKLIDQSPMWRLYRAGAATHP